MWKTWSKCETSGERYIGKYKKCYIEFLSLSENVHEATLVSNSNPKVMYIHVLNIDDCVYVNVLEC